MTSDISTCTVPTFRTHSRALAIIRALCVVVLCAALTAGFLMQVWRAPPASEPPPNDLQAETTAVSPRAS